MGCERRGELVRKGGIEGCCVWSAVMAARPQNVGILAMDVYFPASYVSQVCNRALDCRSWCCWDWTRGRLCFVLM